MSDDILAFNRLRGLSVGHPGPWYGSSTIDAALLADLQALVRFTDDVVNDNARISDERDKLVDVHNLCLVPVSERAETAEAERDRLRKLLGTAKIRHRDAKELGRLQSTHIDELLATLRRVLYERIGLGEKVLDALIDAGRDETARRAREQLGEDT